MVEEEPWEGDHSGRYRRDRENIMDWTRREFVTNIGALAIGATLPFGPVSYTHLTLPTTERV